MRLGALIGFFLSFHTGSLLVFYYGFLFLLLLLKQIQSGQRWYIISRDSILRHIDYIILPFLFWTWDRWLTPSHGYYANYNEPLLSFDHLVYGIYTLLFRALIPSLKEGIVPFYLMYPISILLVLFICYLLSLLVYFPPKFIFTSKSNTSRLMGYGLFLLFLGSFPYIAIGQSFGSYGWATKNSLLIALPMSIVLIAILRLLFFNSGSIRSRFVFPVIIFIICGFSADYLKTYVNWQALAVKEHSVFYNLSKMKGAEDYTVIEIQNEFIIPETIDYYPTVVWTYQLGHAFGDLKRFAFQTRPGASKTFGGPPKIGQLYTQKELLEMIEATTVSYALNEIDLTGKQGILTIRHGFERGSRLNLAFKYWYYRFIEPRVLPSFLAKITSLELKPRLL